MVCCRMEHKCEKMNDHVSITTDYSPYANFSWVMQFGQCKHKIDYCPYCGDRLPVKRPSRKGVVLKRFDQDEDDIIIGYMLGLAANENVMKSFGELAIRLERSVESVKHRWYVVLLPKIKDDSAWE